MEPMRLIMTLISIYFLSLTSVRAHNAPIADDTSPAIFNDSTTWIDEQKQTHKLSDYKDSAMVVSMLYTECKRICPELTVDKLKEIQRNLDQKSQTAQFVIVTFDPANDTPEVLAKFKKKIGMDRPNWHFLRGSAKQTHEFAEKLDLGNYWKVDDHIQHVFKIVFLDFKDGRKRNLDWDHRDVATLFN